MLEAGRNPVPLEIIIEEYLAHTGRKHYGLDVSVGDRIADPDWCLSRIAPVLDLSKIRPVGASVAVRAVLGQKERTGVLWGGGYSYLFRQDSPEGIMSMVLAAEHDANDLSLPDQEPLAIISLPQADWFLVYSGNTLAPSSPIHRNNLFLVTEVLQKAHSIVTCIARHIPSIQQESIPPIRFSQPIRMHRSLSRSVPVVPPGALILGQERDGLNKSMSNPGVKQNLTSELGQIWADANLSRMKNIPDDIPFFVQSLLGTGVSAFQRLGIREFSFEYGGQYAAKYRYEGRMVEVPIWWGKAGDKQRGQLQVQVTTHPKEGSYGLAIGMIRDVIWDGQSWTVNTFLHDLLVEYEASASSRVIEYTAFRPETGEIDQVRYETAYNRLNTEQVGSQSRAARRVIEGIFARQYNFELSLGALWGYGK